MAEVYVYADVGRTGLGNMLLPWARAEVLAHRHGWPMLAPRWTQPKVGPLLRGERDKRFYTGVFDNRGYVRGPARWRALLAGRRVDEAAMDGAGSAVDVKALLGPAAGTRPIVVTCRGLGGWFGPLLPHRELIHRRLTEVLSERTRAAVASAAMSSGPPGAFIAAHVRRGDMTVLPFGKPYPAGPGNFTPSGQWFARAIAAVRAAVGRDLPVLVFSDGRDDELTDVLAAPNVARAPSPRAAVIDILEMSRAAALIATGRSSFSAWAGFLGQMPVVSYPGTRVVLSADHPERSVETDLSGDLVGPWPVV